MFSAGNAISLVQRKIQYNFIKTKKNLSMPCRTSTTIKWQPGGQNFTDEVLKGVFPWFVGAQNNVGINCQED